MLDDCVPLVLSVGDKVSPNSEQFFLQVCKCGVDEKLFSESYPPSLPSSKERHGFWFV